MSPDTNIGPVTTPPQYRKVLEYIDIARREGARCVLGGTPAAGLPGGQFVEPTIFVDVTPQMRIAREEVFGPVLSIIGFDDEDEAIRLANDTIYGLAAGVWTENMGRAADVARARPVLEALGRTLIHVGDAGAGHAVKALNNYVSAAGLIAVSEALVAARRFGIDPHVVNSVFNASTGKNNTTEHKVENFMLSGRYDSGFALALMRKDLQTAAGFIDRMGTPGEFARKTLDVARDAEQALGDGADHTAMHAYVSGRAPD